MRRRFLFPLFFIATSATASDLTSILADAKAERDPMAELASIMNGSDTALKLAVWNQIAASGDDTLRSFVLPMGLQSGDPVLRSAALWSYLEQAGAIALKLTPAEGSAGEARVWSFRIYRRSKDRQAFEIFEIKNGFSPEDRNDKMSLIAETLTISINERWQAHGSLTLDDAGKALVGPVRITLADGTREHYDATLTLFQ